MPTVMTVQQVQQALDQLAKLQAVYEEKLREQHVQHQLAMARILDEKAKEKEAARNAMPEEPYMFPVAKCSNCGHSYVQLKNRRKRLHVNDAKFVKPRADLSGAVLCPKCNNDIVGKRDKYHPLKPTEKEEQLEKDLLENPSKYPMFAPIAGISTPEADQGLHDLQIQNDTLVAQQRKQAMIDKQVVVKDRLIRRLTQQGEIMAWCSKHKADPFASIGHMFMEGARVCILDGTDPKLARRDRAAAVRELCETFKVNCPLPKKPPIIRRHGHQQTWKHALPGSSDSGPANPTDLVAHVGDEHATSTVFHTETFEPAKKPADAGKTKTFEYVKPKPMAGGATQNEVASKVGAAVAALYRAPVARSLQTVLGEQVDIENAKGLPTAVQELLAVENLTQYANEGAQLHPLTFNNETYVMYVTCSVDLQVYIAVYDGVFGWATYEEVGHDDFKLAIRRGHESEAFVTVTAADLTAYPEAERKELVTLFDHMLYLLNRKEA